MKHMNSKQGGMAVVVGVLLLACCQQGVSPCMAAEGPTSKPSNKERLYMLLRLVSSTDKKAIPLKDADVSRVKVQFIFVGKERGSASTSAPVACTVREGHVVVDTPIPYDELAKIGLTRDDLDRVEVSVFLEATRSFAFSGQLSTTLAAITREDKAWYLPVTPHNYAKPKPVKVVCRLISAVTKEPVSEYRVRAGGNELTTNAKGLVTVTVKDPGKGFFIAESQLNKRGPERLKHVKVAPDKVAQFLKDGKPIETQTQMPRVVGHVWPDGMKGEEARRIADAMSGYVLIRHELGPKRVFEFRSAVHRGTFYIHEDERGHIRPGTFGRIVRVGGDITEGFFLKAEVAYRIPQVGDGHTVKVPVAMRQEVTAAIRVRDRRTSELVEGATVCLQGNGLPERSASSKGIVLFPKVKTGPYKMKVVAPGYETRVIPAMVLGQEYLDVRLRYLCDVSVSLPSSAGQAIDAVVLVSGPGAGRREYGVRVRAGASTVTIEDVPEDKAFLLAAIRQGHVCYMKPVEVKRKTPLEVKQVPTVKAVIDTNATGNIRKWGAVVVVDREMMLPMLKLEPDSRGATLSLSLPCRPYLVFLEVPDGLLGDSGGWVFLGELDLRKAKPGSTTKRTFELPARPVPLNRKTILGNPDWQKRRKQAVTPSQVSEPRDSPQ